MAEATVVEKVPAPNESSIGYVTVASGSNIAAGNNDKNYYFGPYTGLAIRTGTLTAMNVTVHLSIDGTNYVDVTSGLFGVATLASSTYYNTENKRLHARFIKLRWAQSNATNAVAFEALFTKDRK